MEEKKLKLLIDFDDVICENFMLKQVNSYLGTEYKIDDFKDYVIDSIIPKDKKEEFYKRISNEKIYENLKLIKGAKEALKKLNKKYDIYICSSCVLIVEPVLSGPHFASKYNFLIKNLPFLDPKKFVFTSSKDIICGDIMIDDYLHNLKYSNVKTKYLFSSYHNKNFKDEELRAFNVQRVEDWADIVKILM